MAEQNEKSIPLSVAMEESKKGYIMAINQVNEKFKLPMFLVDSILTGILADVRQQKNAELASDYAKLNEPEKEGENNG